MRAPLFIAACLALLAASCARRRRSLFHRLCPQPRRRRLLYVESHSVARRRQADETRVVLYRCAAGFRAVRAQGARLRRAIAPRPPSRFEDARSGFAEGLTRDARGLDRVRACRCARADCAREPVDVHARSSSTRASTNSCATRWDSLERGAASTCRSSCPSRLDSVAFECARWPRRTIDGEAASVIRLSLAGPLGWFLPDIDVSYRKRDRRLMRYRGITNIRDAGGELLEAQIDFPEAGHTGAAVDLAALRALPLASCGGSLTTSRGRRILLLVLVEPLHILLVVSGPAHQRHAREHDRHSRELVRAQLSRRETTSRAPRRSPDSRSCRCRPSRASCSAPATRTRCTRGTSSAIVR